jgi:hypothetical protein
VDADLDTLATALYVRVDDALKDDLTLAPRRAKVSFRPKRSDAELITLAVLQALAGFVSETRWLRYARIHLRHLSPICPASPATTNVWLIDATPVECGRSRPTAKRSDTAGWSGYGYVASHTRYFWGLRLHLICTPAGLPITFALTNPTTDEREIARDMLEAEPDLRPPPRPNPHRRQGLRLGRVRGVPRQPRRPPAAPCVQERTPPARRPPAQTAPPDHRIGQRHPQRPARSRTPRRADLQRSRRTNTATRPRPHRRHLAQRPHRPTSPAIAHRYDH